MSATIRRERQHRRSDTLLMLLCALVICGCVAVLGTRATVAQPPVPPTLRSQVTGLKDPSAFRLQFAGDTMLGDKAQPLIDAEGLAAPFAHVKELHATADYTMVNAEAPITAREDNARPGAQFAYAMVPAAAQAFVDAGVDGIALGNNHVTDRGEAGLMDTIEHARAAGLDVVGAGANLAEGGMPLLLESSAGTVGIVNLAENFGPLARADETKPGMVPFTPARIQAGYDTAKAAGADVVVAYVHWGDNYAGINESQEYWGGLLAQAGYDVVIGAGSHAAQGVRHVNGVPIVYGLGNYVFGSRGRYAQFGQPGYGFAATVVVNAGRASSLELACVATDNRNPTVNFKTRLCTPEEAADAFSRYATDASVDGAVATITLDR